MPGASDRLYPMAFLMENVRCATIKNEFGITCIGMPMARKHLGQKYFPNMAANYKITCRLTRKRVVHLFPVG